MVDLAIHIVSFCVIVYATLLVCCIPGLMFACGQESKWHEKQKKQFEQAIAHAHIRRRLLADAKGRVGRAALKRGLCFTDLEHHVPYVHARLCQRAKILTY